MKEPEAGYPAGTWLRFQHNGRITIGVVQYVREPSSCFHGPWLYVTDAGEVQSARILEAR